MIEKLKSALKILNEKDTDYANAEWMTKYDEAFSTLIPLAEAAVESRGKLSKLKGLKDEYVDGYNDATEDALPAFALLQSEYKELEKERDEISEENGALKYSEAKLIAELAEAKREINHLHECLDSLNASLDKQKLEDMGVENARLAAFKARVKGITESDIEHILTFTAPDKCAAAVLALVKGE